MKKTEISGEFLQTAGILPFFFFRKFAAQLPQISIFLHPLRKAHALSLQVPGMLEYKQKFGTSGFLSSLSCLTTASSEQTNIKII